METVSWGGFGVARPLWNSLWLRLFGADGPTTIAELRGAILHALPGQSVADGSVIARIRAIVTANTSPPERPDSHGADENAVRLLGPDTALLLDPRIPVSPGADVDDHGRVSIPATDLFPITTVVTDPGQTAAPAGGRIATLLVAADPAVALGLTPIEYGPANAGDPFHDATKDNPFGTGWLATWLAQQSGTMQISWDADSLGQAATDLGLLLGPVLGSLALSGDYSAGYTLAPLSTAIDQVTLAAGHDYNLMIGDNCVAAGQSLLVDASALGAADHAAFDGSTVTDGSFTFIGGAGDDRFFGGAGDDILRGLGGADTLTGGGGSDTFVYLAAGDAYDTLADFNPAQDKIDLPGTVTGFDTAIQSGALSTGSFSADLGAALAGLGAGHAVVYAPNAGDLAGKIFLVVDANGVAGYQEGEDYVFALPATTLADLSAHPDFFI
jgi:hypothetical protein